MNILKTKYRRSAIALTLASTIAAALPVHAQGGTSQQQSASKQENIGVLSGFAVGAAAGGPIGAFVGATTGALLGDHYHKQQVKNSTLSADLKKSQSDKQLLAQNMAKLNDSLVASQVRAGKLDHTVALTDEIGTDVSFRTNDDSVNDQSIAPLMKLGALAASMPDVRVRVSGYADPRGSDKLNDELSKRRAAAVAAVLKDSGVSKDQIVMEAHGKAEAMSEDGDLDGYAFDRRVTVRLERSGAGQVASRD